MAATVTQSSKYVEGGYQTRRFQVTGDTSYPTGGYDILTAPNGVRGNVGNSTVGINRVINVRHRTVASATLGSLVLVDGYSSGYINSLKLAIVSGNAELTAGTSTATLNCEVVIESN